MRRMVVLVVLGLASVADAYIGAQPEPSEDALVREGNARFAEGDHGGAAQRYERAVARHPRLVAGWYNLGLARTVLALAAGRDPGPAAARAFERAARLDPGHAPSRASFVATADLRAARRLLAVAMRRVPHDGRVWLDLAQLERRARHPERAIAAALHAAEIEADPARRPDERYVAAVLSYQLLEARPELPRGERGRVADAAIAALEQADRERPGHAPTLAYLDLLRRARDR